MCKIENYYRGRYSIDHKQQRQNLLELDRAIQDLRNKIKNGMLYDSAHSYSVFVLENRCNALTNGQKIYDVILFYNPAIDSASLVDYRKHGPAAPQKNHKPATLLERLIATLIPVPI